jgi:hypothetical protein
MNNTKVAGVAIPDSRMAREITELIRDSASELLFQHSRRVYFWGALMGQRKGLRFDPELLYAAAMFHDIGITPHYHGSELRFEVDGANAARDFLRRQGVDEADVQMVWLAVALHTTPGIPEHMHPEISLVQAGAGMDMTGRHFDEFSDDERAAVIAACPRGHHFGHQVIETFYQGLKRRPGSTFGTFNDDFLAFRDPGFRRANLCSLILGSPWRAATEPHQH